MYIYRSIMFGGRMILYHGSEHRIEKPQFGKGKLHNDYGRGFYCTEHIALANEWAIDHNRNGYCNAYKIDIESLNVLQLNDSMYSILHWITVLLENIGAEKVLSEEWYGAKFERDRQARKKYQEMRNEPWTKGNIYMMALLEQEVKADDERIRL